MRWLAVLVLGALLLGCDPGADGRTVTSYDNLDRDTAGDAADADAGRG